MDAQVQELISGLTGTCEKETPESQSGALTQTASLIALLADATLLLDGDLRMVHANAAFLSRLQLPGNSPSNIEQKAAADLLDAQNVSPDILRECMHAKASRCIQGAAATDLDGKSFVVKATLVPVQGKAEVPEGIVIMLRGYPGDAATREAAPLEEEELEDLLEMRTLDLRCALDVVTEESELQEQSKHREIARQKSVFAGRLATGLAHEFNSPIACILANQGYLASRLLEVHAAMSCPPPEWSAFFQEANEILGEDSNSIQRLSATVKTLQGFCLTSEPGEDTASDEHPRLDEIFKDTQLALNTSDIGKELVQICFPDNDVAVIAHKAEVSLALLSLMRFLLNHEAPENPTNPQKGPRTIQMQSSQDALHSVIELNCEQLDIDIDEAESAFDPSLVVGEGNRVKLSVELSICAARIARNGGNVQFRKSSNGGTVIEVRFQTSSL